MNAVVSPESLSETVREIVRQTPVFDIHTHLFAPQFASLALSGIDNLLDYHYLVAETLRGAPIEYAAFFALPQSRRAEIVWHQLFAGRAPLSQATRGVVSVLSFLGLNANTRNLSEIRREYSQRDPQRHLEACLRIANVRRIAMTNSPFDEAERAVWESREHAHDSRFAAALRLDPLLMEWQKTAAQLSAWNYDVRSEIDAKTLSEVRRFLEEWTNRMQPLYLMVSLPPDFSYAATAASTREESFHAQLLDGAILPFCRERNLPLALMLGVRRGVNPKLQLAGDGVEKSDLNALRELCARHSKNKFLVTVLSRENQHELCVLARKFSNLHLFGCWWFCNTQSLVEEITTMRLELLGADFTLQHSDARVLDQIIYKWHDAREVAVKVLTRQYELLESAGRRARHEEIKADVEELFGGAFERFLAK